MKFKKTALVFRYKNLFPQIKVISYTRTRSERDCLKYVSPVMLTYHAAFDSYLRLLGICNIY
jgi:hypothetical protein